MRNLFIFMIRIYQRFISPLLPPSCRFYPSCSEYSLQAIKKYGIFKGSYLSVRRILRCNPYHEGGFDPVPENFKLFGKEKHQFGGN